MAMVLESNNHGATSRATFLMALPCTTTNGGDPPFPLEPVEDVGRHPDPKDEQAPDPAVQEIVIVEERTPRISHDVAAQGELEDDGQDHPHQVHPDRLTRRGKLKETA